MAKDKGKAAELTGELPGLKRRPGRPSVGDRAMTGAERVKRLRAERKAAGLCPCCGQALPAK